MGLGRVYEGLRAGLITGALIGAFAGSTYRSIDHAYETTLKALGNETKAKMEVINSLKKDLPKEIYQSKIEKYGGILEDTTKRLDQFKKGSDYEKKKMALTDFRNLRKTSSKLNVLPQKFSDFDPRGPIGKGAIYGAGAGVVGAGGIMFARKRKQKKQKLRKNLEISSNR